MEAVKSVFRGLDIDINDCNTEIIINKCLKINKFLKKKCKYSSNDNQESYDNLLFEFMANVLNITIQLLEFDNRITEIVPMIEGDIKDFQQYEFNTLLNSCCPQLLTQIKNNQKKIIIFKKYEDEDEDEDEDEEDYGCNDDYNCYYNNVNSMINNMKMYDETELFDNMRNYD